MNTGAVILGWIGLAAAAVCLAAYIRAYILKARAFRPASIVALMFTIFAMAQLGLWLNGYGAEMNGVHAMIFLIISGAAQSYNALSGRSTGPRARDADEAKDRPLQD